jgi:hypothetical protein
VQLAQLLRRDVEGRAHERIFGAVVHGEEHDLAQISSPHSNLPMRSLLGAIPPGIARKLPRLRPSVASANSGDHF